jgi:hypothetical protein
MPTLQAINGIKAHPTETSLFRISNGSKAHLLLTITHYPLPITY